MQHVQQTGLQVAPRARIQCRPHGYLIHRAGQQRVCPALVLDASRHNPDVGRGFLGKKPLAHPFDGGLEIDGLAAADQQGQRRADHGGAGLRPKGVVPAKIIHAEHQPARQPFHVIERAQAAEQVETRVALRPEHHHVLFPPGPAGISAHLRDDAVHLRIEDEQTGLVGMGQQLLDGRGQ